MYVHTESAARSVVLHDVGELTLRVELVNAGRVHLPLTKTAMDDLARIVDGWRAAGTVPGKPEPVCDHCHRVVWPCALDGQLRWRHKESGSWFCSDPQKMAEVAGSTRVPAGMQS